MEVAKKLIDATRMSIRGGERINLDLLNAQSQYYQARSDLAKARYDYLNSFLHLNADAGTLSAEDIKKLGKSFARSTAVTVREMQP